MTGRYDEYFMGMVTGLSYAVMMFGVMVAGKDLATDAPSWLVGGFLIIVGAILGIVSILSIIDRVRESPDFPSDTSDRGE